MDKNAEERDMQIRTPDNCLKSKRYFGFKIRNIIEGVILTLLVSLGIFQIPFVPRVKAIFIVIIGLVVLLISCNGIKNQSVTELLQNFYENSKSKKIYHLRSVKYAKKQNKFKLSNAKIAVKQSNAEKAFDTVKEKILTVKDALKEK